METKEVLEEDEKVPFIAKQDEKLDKQAFKRACLMSEKSSVLVALGDEKQINATMDKMKNFDYHVISLINTWSNSTHPEMAAERVSIEGKKASEYMKEKGYSFMDCMIMAQTAIEKNKPFVEFDMAEESMDKKTPSQKINLSDPKMENTPPSHMPKLLNRFLKIVTFGFYQNREERTNYKKEMELIRSAAIEKSRLEHMKKEDKSAKAQEARRKQEQNRERAKQAEERREEYKLYQHDEKHSKNRLQKMEEFRKDASEKLTQLGDKHEKLQKQAREYRKKLEGIGQAKESAEKWLKENPDWKSSPAKMQTASKMLERVKEYHQVRQEYEKVGSSLAKVTKASEKVMVALGEAEGKRPRMTELYQKQAEHKLTEAERKELSELEKPGELVKYSQAGQKKTAENAAPEKENTAAKQMAGKQGPNAGKQAAGKQNQQQARKQAAGKQGPNAAKQAQQPAKQGPNAARQAQKQSGKQNQQQAGKQAQQPAKQGPNAARQAQRQGKQVQQKPVKQAQQAAKQKQPAAKGMRK